jgi:hypothetical protein
MKIARKHAMECLSRLFKKVVEVKIDSLILTHRIFQFGASTVPIHVKPSTIILFKYFSLNKHGFKPVPQLFYIEFFQYDKKPLNQ